MIINFIKYLSGSSAFSIRLISCQLKLFLLILILYLALFSQAGMVESWLWQDLVLAFFLCSLFDLLPLFEEYLIPWSVLFFYILYCLGQSACGSAAVIEVHGYGSYYPWETKRSALELGYFLIFGLACSSILRSKESVQKLIFHLAAFVFLLCIWCFLEKTSFIGILCRGHNVSFWGLAFGPFGNKNHFSAFMLLVMPLFLGYLQWRWRLWEGSLREINPSFWERWASFFKTSIPFLFFLTGFMAFMIFLARGKFALIVFLPALVIYLFFLLGSNKKIAMILGACVITVFILFYKFLPAYPGQQDYFKGTLKYSTVSRLQAYKGTLEFYKGYPVFGTGLGTYYYLSTRFVPGSADNGIWGNAHNDHLEVLFETGIVGFLLFLLFIILCLRQGLVNFRRHHCEFHKMLVLQSLVSLGIFSILEAVDFHIRSPIIAMLALVQVGILFIPVSGPQPDVFAGETKAVLSRGRMIFLLLSLAGVLALAKFTWDEQRYNSFLGSKDIVVLRQGVSAFPQSAPLWFSLAQAYVEKMGTLKQGSQRSLLLRQAIDCLEKATAIAPSFSYYWQLLAALQVQNGQRYSALETLRVARYWAPFSKRARLLVK